MTQAAPFPITAHQARALEKTSDFDANSIEDIIRVHAIDGHKRAYFARLEAREVAALVAAGFAVKYTLSRWCVSWEK